MRKHIIPGAKGSQLIPPGKPAWEKKADRQEIPENYRKQGPKPDSFDQTMPDALSLFGLFIYFSL
jgi:hypothetical protein